MGEEKEVNRLLVQGFKAAKEQRRDEAYQIFCEVVQLDPSNENGWLYRAATTEDLAEAYVCLQRVISLNPDNAKAQRGLEKLKARMDEESEMGVNIPASPVSNLDAAAAAVVEQAQIPPEPNPTPPPPARTNFGDTELVSGFGIPPSIGTPKVESDSLQPFSFDQPTSPSGFAAPNNKASTVSFNLPDEKDEPLKFDEFGKPNAPAQSDKMDAYFKFNDFADQPPPNRIGVQDDEAFNPPPAPHMTNLWGVEREQTGERIDVKMPPQPANDYYDSYSEEEAYLKSAARDSIPGVTSQRDAFVQASQNRAQVNDRAAYAGILTDDGLGNEVKTNLNDRGRGNRTKLRSYLIVALIGTLFLMIMLVYFVFNWRTNNQNTQDPNTIVGLVTTTPDASVTTGTEQTPGSSTVVPNGTVAVITTTVATNLTPGNTTTQTGGTPATVATTAPARTTAPGGTPGVLPPAPTPTVIPAGTNAPTAPTVVPAITRAQFYTPRPGDNLTSIAARFNTSIDAIKAANREPPRQINGDTIIANVVYIIPVNRPDFRGRGTVLPVNETPDKLAARYGVALDQILKLNGYAAAADIKPGDVILLP